MTIVTRSYNRPDALHRNRTSVRNQSDKDYEHIFILDYIGRGRLWANQQFYTNRHRVTGDYVFLLDDDDYLIEPDFIRYIKQIVNTHAPEVIMVKMQTHAHIFPKPDVWQKHIIMGSIGTSCFCVSNQVYQRHIKAFGRTSCGDYHFIKEVFNHNYKIYWLDKIVARIDATHREKPKQHPPPGSPTPKPKQGAPK